jgi:hypothetical protein
MRKEKEKQKEKEAMLFINDIPYFMLERNLNKMLLIELWLGTLIIQTKQEETAYTGIRQIETKREQPKWKEYMV